MWPQADRFVTDDKFSDDVFEVPRSFYSLAACTAVYMMYCSSCLPRLRYFLFSDVNTKDCVAYRYVVRLHNVTRLFQLPIMRLYVAPL